MGELFGQYYGMDWVAMITSLIFMYYVGDKKRYAFIFGIISALAWTYTNVAAHIWAGVALNIILIGLYVRGYVKWKKSDDNQTLSI